MDYHRYYLVRYGYLYLIVSLLAFISFINTLTHGFVFDDEIFILKSPFIQDWRNLFSIFSADYLKHPWDSLDVNRPLMVISLILDFSIWGFNPIGYHLTNLALHVASSIVLLYLLNFIFSDVKIPFIAAILFAIHPIHIQAVNAINFREDLLVTLFYLTSLGCFISGINSNNDRSSLVLSVLFYLLALLSKEMAITLPIICFLYMRVWKRTSSPKWVFMGYIIATAFYFLFYLYAQQFYGVAVSYNESLIERIYGAMVIFGRYIWLHLFPISLIADYDDRLFFTFDFANTLSVIFAATLMFWAFYRLTFKPASIFFWLGWFFITLSPVMNIVPILNPIAERYLYLPSVGFLTTIAIGLGYLLDKKRRVFSLMVIVALLLLVLTINGNMVWKDEYSLWHDTLKKVPENANAHKQIGLLYLEKNRFEDAKKHFMYALKFAPNNPVFKGSVHGNLGAVYMKSSQYIKAHEEFQAAVKLDPENYEAHTNLGVLYARDFEYDKALIELEAALKLKPNGDAVNYILGTVYAKTGRKAKAYSAYNKALELNSNNAAAYFALGELLYEDSDIKSAIEVIKRGLIASPNDVWAHAFLGDLYMKSGSKEMAKEEYDYASRLGRRVFK